MCSRTWSRDCASCIGSCGTGSPLALLRDSSTYTCFIAQGSSIKTWNRRTYSWMTLLLETARFWRKLTCPALNQLRDWSKSFSLQLDLQANVKEKRRRGTKFRDEEWLILLIKLRITKRWAYLYELIRLYKSCYNWVCWLGISYNWICWVGINFPTQHNNKLYNKKSCWNTCFSRDLLCNKV